MKMLLLQQATHIQSTGSISPFPPQSVSGSTAINGGFVKTLGYREAIIGLQWAVVTGAPTAATLNVALWTNTSASTSGATLLFQYATALNVMTAGSVEYHTNLLTSLGYVYLVITPTYTGGTSPANLVAGDMVLGNAYTEPVPGQGAAAATVYGS